MTDPDIASIFSRPQFGGDLPYFKGKQYGRGKGSSILKDVERVGYPLLIRTSKALGRIGVNSIDDYLHKNKGLGESLAANATTEFDNVKDQLRNVFADNGSRKRKRQKGKGFLTRGSTINKRRKLIKTIFDN